MSTGDPTVTAPEDEPRVAPPRATRRWAVGLLVAGALSAAYILMPHVPRDRQIDLRIEEPNTVTGVEITWSRPASAGHADEQAEEPLRGASFRFPPGTAPKKINYFVRLPDGS